MIPVVNYTKINFFEFHINKTWSHTGVKKTLARIAQQFFWPNMLEEMRNFVRQSLI